MSAAKRPKIAVRCAGRARLRDYMLSHPWVELEAFERSDEHFIEFRQDEWVRRVMQGHPAVEGPYGLIEVMDNNPLVCADQASVPGPAATLALVCLSPLVRAGLLEVPPSVAFTFETDFDEVETALRQLGWVLGAICAAHPSDVGGAMAATAVAQTHTSVSEVEEMFDEAYGQSFFVKRVSPQELVPAAVIGSPNALLAISRPIEGDALYVQAMADPNGKCGAAQLVHMFNVMAGFEENLGITVITP